MRITITGKGMDVSDYLKEVAEKKVKKLSKYFGGDTEAHVTMSIEKSRHIVEVTIPFDGVVLRGEVATGDMYASIDGVLKKLEKQIMRVLYDISKENVEKTSGGENTKQATGLKVIKVD